jgi:hypothetical protein
MLETFSFNPLLPSYGPKCIRQRRGEAVRRTSPGFPPWIRITRGLTRWTSGISGMHAVWAARYPPQTCGFMPRLMSRDMSAGDFGDERRSERALLLSVGVVSAREDTFGRASFASTYTAIKSEVACPHGAKPTDSAAQDRVRTSSPGLLGVQTPSGSFGAVSCFRYWS